MSADALKAIALSGCGVDDVERVANDLERFRQLLIKWQAVQNLVARDTLSEFWARHISDSLQLVPLLPVATRTITDLGSGGGFPALPLAIALKGRDIDLTLVESNGRKVAFLRAVARELNLRVSVVDKRIEALVSRETQLPDIITARALSALTDLCRYSMPLWGDRTRALFHKGREHVEELRESAALWQFDVVKHPSVVDRTGVILEIEHLRPLAG